MNYSKSLITSVILSHILSIILGLIIGYIEIRIHYKPNIPQITLEPEI